MDEDMVEIVSVIYDALDPDEPMYVQAVDVFEALSGRGWLP